MPRYDALPPQLAPRMRVKEAGAVLGVSADTVRRLVARGELGCNRIGGSIRIGPEHLQAYLERTECPARDPTEAGASENDPTGPASMPIDESTDGINGYRLVRRTRNALDKSLPTSKPKLSVIET